MMVVFNVSACVLMLMSHRPRNLFLFSDSTVKQFVANLASTESRASFTLVELSSVATASFFSLDLFFFLFCLGFLLKIWVFLTLVKFL